jgi:four helix bundle protein
VSDFKALKVWRKAHALALNVRRVSVKMRGAENAALRNQMTRAAMSIATNIVEGTGKKVRESMLVLFGSHSIQRPSSNTI